MQVAQYECKHRAGRGVLVSEGLYERALSRLGHQGGRVSRHVAVKWCKSVRVIGSQGPYPRAPVAPVRAPHRDRRRHRPGS